MRNETQFTVNTFTAVRGRVPALCVLHVSGSTAHPAQRRVLVRGKHETGEQLWARTVEEADAIGLLHEPVGTAGSIDFHYCTLAEFEQRFGDTARANYRLALHWFMAADKPGATRVWAATKLAQLIGMLPENKERAK